MKNFLCSVLLYHQVRLLRLVFLLLFHFNFELFYFHSIIIFGISRNISTLHWHFIQFFMVAFDAGVEHPLLYGGFLVGFFFFKYMVRCKCQVVWSFRIACSFLDFYRFLHFTILFLFNSFVNVCKDPEENSPLNHEKVTLYKNLVLTSVSFI